MYQHFKKKKFFLKLISVIVFASLFLSACQQKEPQTELIRPVKTMVVGSKITLSVRQFPAKVIADQEVKMAFEVLGSLIQLPIHEGQIVHKGQLLARLDPTQYENNLTEMRAIYIRTKADYERAKKLVQGGYISRTDYDTKRAEYLVALANKDTASKDLRDTYLYAPFAGVIARKYVDNYQKVQAKEVILLLQDVAHIGIEINVSENIVLNLKKEQGRKFDVFFAGAPNLKFLVVFKEFSSEADPETQTYRVVFTMPAPKTIRVLPGMTATLMVPLPDFKSGSEQYFVIPGAAVFDGPDKEPSVWVVNPVTLQVNRTPIKITRLENNAVRVISGLDPGQRIVVAGVHFIREGQTVKVLEPKKQP